MSERSITRRNFWGGFWGGILGIFAVGWIHPLVLPAGCLVGVVAGFWYQEIGQLVYRCFREYFLRLRRARRRTMIRLRYARTACTTNIADSCSATRNWFTATWRSTADRLSTIKHCWFTENKPAVARMCAIILFAGAHVCSGVYVFMYALTIRNDKGVVQWSPSTLGFLFFILLMVFLPAVLTFNSMTRPRKEVLLEQRHKRYCQHGWWYCFGYDLSAMARTEAAMVLVTLLGATFWIASIWLIAIPITATILTLHGIYQIALRRQHWLCLSVTLLVTTTIACLGHAYLNGVMLWLVALVCGCLAGTFASTAHRHLALFFEQHRRVRILARMRTGRIVDPPMNYLCRRMDSVLGVLMGRLMIQA